MTSPYSTIEQLADAMNRGDISAVEITRAHLDRIDALDGTLHAYCAVDGDAALMQAERCDVLRRQQGSGSPLLGIPLGIKDIFDHAGYSTRAGSDALDDRLSDRSATAVEKLLSAGMVPLGRTHMVEFAFGGWGTNPVQGAPCNPWGIEGYYVAGGSSSGSAVAVAAGLAPAALGTDTGGSIRTPAAWCGIVGLKTSHGLVSRAGVVPLCPTHDSVGPMARSVRDVAILLDAMLGADRGDRATLTAPDIRPLERIEDGVAGLSIAVLGESDLADVEPEIRRHYEAATADLARLGADVSEIALPLPIGDYLTRGGDIMSVESHAYLSRYLDRAGSPVDPVIAARIRRGADISGPDYFRILQARLEAQQAFSERFAGFHALVMPGSHRSPVPLADVDEDQPSNLFGRLVNYLDLAALAIPVGVTARGLPVGMQIAVGKFDDAMALRVGRALERERGGLFVPPPDI